MNSHDTGLLTDRAALLHLAVEWWRLERWLTLTADPTGQARARRFRRTVDAILEPHDISVRDFTGQPFTEGLAVEVIEAIDDITAPDGLGIIAEMVSPSVSLGDSVIRCGQVVLRRKPLAPSNNSQPEQHEQQEIIITEAKHDKCAPHRANHRRHKKGNNRGRHI